MKKQRPINIQLQTIHFSIIAIASILHRISGIISFIIVGILLWLLGLSLSSPKGFQFVTEIMCSFFIKFIIWSLLTILIYHVSNGIYHMMMDFNFIDKNLLVGRISVIAIFIITSILSILSWIFIW
ncbi:MAG: succinate dehydrogenase, cytochrome b556 subunit [Arsenophonus sp. ET-DL12-MAG3]